MHPPRVDLSGNITTKHEDIPSFSIPISLVERIGAGEGIRTLDPNLGKVVLYP
jgi:hypothetical protein